MSQLVVKCMTSYKSYLIIIILWDISTFYWPTLWFSKQVITTTTVLRPFVRATRVSPYQKKHSPTHHPDPDPIFISFFHLPRSIAFFLFKLRAWQSFCTTSPMSSLVYLLVWSPPPHIPYISSPNQCLLFAAHAHTIATSFAVVSILYHVFLVFLSTPYLELCLLP